MKNNIVIGMGEVLWDVLPEGKKLGGAPCNFAYHVSQFGLDARGVSAIGNDELGSEIIENLNDKGVKYHIDTVGYPTGTVQVELDSKGVPQYEIKEGVAWDNIPFTSELESLAKEAKAVCFGSLAQRNGVSAATIKRFLDAIPAENKALIVFDINLRQNFYNKEVLEESIRRCNILKINDEELEIVSKLFNLKSTSAEDACRELIKDYHLDMLILTCGTDGSYVFTSDGSMSFLPTPKVEVADTVGAGDSFTAAFIASILKGKSVADAHRKAVDVSAFVCTQNGAMPVLPKELINA